MRVVVERESEWDDEQRELVQALELYEAGIHGPCGNHASVALDKTVARYVAHETFICEDCRAIELERKAFHATHATGPDGDCACKNEVFWIDKRVPFLPES